MNEFLSLSRIQEILSSARSLRVGVVGDFTLDGYWHADMTRSALSRETPLFPRPVVRERYSCGGAANVAWNLAALGLAEVRAFTVLGEDWRGALLRQSLQEVGVDPRDILVDAGWSTPFFGKVILTSGSQQQEDSRLDFVNSNKLSVESEEELLDRLEARLSQLDALIVADYQDIGVVTSRVLEGLNDLAARVERPIFTVDSRERIGQFQNMVRKPNEFEAARWLFPGSRPRPGWPGGIRGGGPLSAGELRLSVVHYLGRERLPGFIQRGEPPRSRGADLAAGRSGGGRGYFSFCPDRCPGGGRQPAGSRQPWAPGRIHHRAKAGRYRNSFARGNYGSCGKPFRLIKNGSRKSIW